MRAEILSGYLVVGNLPEIALFAQVAMCGPLKDCPIGERDLGDGASKRCNLAAQ